MHYLECIEVLNYLQKKLNAGQRKQVPVKDCTEIQSIVFQLKKKLNEENDPAITSRLRDILEAIDLAQSTPGLLFLTDAMKTAITDGIIELNVLICMKAFQYYKTRDVVVNPQTIPLLRTVVSVALNEGVV